MEQLKKYIFETLGIVVQPEQISKQQLGGLPMYIGETYVLYKLVLFNQALLLAEPRQTEYFSILKAGKQLDLLKKAFDRKVVLMLAEMTAFNRKRLIGKGINFIVPGKQLYLPDLLMDLKENFTNKKAKPKTKTLLPSAQLLLIYHILGRDEKGRLEEHSFKEIAGITGYTAMAITKAIDNLKYHQFIEVSGEREKSIRFLKERNLLWDDAIHRNLLINPVLKQVYIDEKHKDLLMLRSNESALPEYTDMNASRQEFYAIDKNVFYGLQKKQALINANENEGRYCLEIWKYNPETLAGEVQNNAAVVDPLSLYLSLKGSHDERIQMALEQIMEHFIW